MNTIKSDITIVGGGVIGLALGKFFSKDRKVILLEKETQIGSHCSSRNSEVIHGGIYYEKDSLKAKFCNIGRNLLYEYADKKNIPYRKCGKLIFASSKDDLCRLDDILLNARQNSVHLSLLSQRQIDKYDNFGKFVAAIFSPETGIVNSHDFLHSLAFDIEKNKGIISKNIKVKEVQTYKNEIELACIQKGEFFKIRSKKVFLSNASGALKLLKKLNPDKYKYHQNYFVKGHYYSYTKERFNGPLLYPIPDELGLGVHLTMDMQGNIRFGPDTTVTETYNDYTDTSSPDCFFTKIKKNFPKIDLNDIAFTYAGVRPKIKIKDKLINDFIIEDECNENLTALMGIESPGLTASLAIASHLYENS